MQCYEIVKDDNVDLNSSVHKTGHDKLSLEKL